MNDENIYTSFETADTGFHIEPVQNNNEADETLVTGVSEAVTTAISSVTTIDIYEQLEHLERNSDGQLLFQGGLFFLLIILFVSRFFKSLIF